MPIKIFMSDGVVPLSTEYYVKALESAGAQVVHNYLPNVDLNYDGLVISGGVDINPKYYGQEIDGSVNVDNARDEIEFKLFNAYLRAGKPIFGICRGCQFVNVALGGSLVQHIDCHQKHTDGKFHTVTTKEKSILHQVHGKEFITNSYHHQAIDKLGKGLKAVAWSENGKIIEGIEHESLPIFAVQWHPERMVETATVYFENSQKAGAVREENLFKKFIEICKKLKGNDNG